MVVLSFKTMDVRLVGADHEGQTIEDYWWPLIPVLLCIFLVSYAVRGLCHTLLLL